jgi:hypothetical protein
MNKLTSLSAAAIASLVVGFGFATASNAQTPVQSPMSDQAYCHLLVDKYTIGLIRSLGGRQRDRCRNRPVPGG